MTPHTIAQLLILPTCSATVRTIHGNEAEQEISKIPPSNDTIRRRIEDMSFSTVENVFSKLKLSDFALQVH